MNLISKAGEPRNFIIRSVIGKFLALILVVSIAVSLLPVANAATFSDVPSNHWAYSAVDYVSTNEYMVGTEDNLFDPNGTLTKAQVITVLHRVADELETTNSQPYTDVTPGRYYYNAVRWAYSKSLSQILQTSSTVFSPGGAVLRYKMAMLIWKFAQVNGWATSTAPAVPLLYSDIGSLTASEKNALKWCLDNSIMTGVSDTAFSPFSSITRAQLAKIIYSFDAFVAKNRAFCVGTNYNNSNHLDTTVDATTARYYYRDMGYDVTCATAPTVTIMRTAHNIKSSVLFFSGHGNNCCITFNYMQSNDPEFKTGVYYQANSNSTGGYKAVGILGNMDFVDLVVFAACETASTDDNIAKRARDYGAKVSIGWTKSVESLNHTNWLSRFNSRLAAGHSIANAVAYADSFTYSSGSNVTDHIVYSRGQHDRDSLVLNGSPGMSSSSSTSEEEQAPEDVLASFRGNTNLKGEDISAEVAAIIQEIDNSFDIKDYKVAVHRSNDVMATIDYTRVIDGFETNSVYVAILYDNKLVSLYDHTKEISKSAKAGVCSLSKRLGISDQATTERGIMAQKEAKESKELTEALRLALEETQSSPAKEAFQQRYCYYFDAENETASILVYTDYYFDGTDAKGVDLYVYDLVSKGVIS